MYIVEFFKKLFSKNNWTALLVVLLSIVVSALFVCAIGGVMCLVFQAAAAFNFLAVFGYSALFFFVVYLLCLTFSLSPLGDIIARLRYKCKKIEDAAWLNRLSGIYQTVTEKVKCVDGKWREAVNIYDTVSNESGVFALGRNTLCFTSGISDMPDEKIEALLARQLGHISNMDTDILTVVTTASGVVAAWIWVVRIFLFACLIPVYIVGGLAFLFVKGLAITFKFCAGAAGGAVAGVFNFLAKPFPWLAKKLFAFIKWFGAFLSKAWHKVSFALISKTRRDAEYSADAFACQCGYKDVLVDIIQNDSPANEEEGAFKVLVKAYPDPISRIAKIQSLNLSTPVEQ